MTLTLLTVLLGWTAIINIVVLCLSFVMITAMQQTVIKIHQALFKVPEAELRLLYIRFMASYKLLNLCLFIAPWLALKILGY